MAHRSGIFHGLEHMGDLHRVRMAGGAGGGGHFQADLLQYPVGLQVQKGYAGGVGKALFPVAVEPDVVQGGTEGGGEGMVVKPIEWLMRGKKGLAQPAVKCRGREYLRIIYGPEYTLDEHIERLRARGLGPKRSLALREFALGLEALHRFVEKEPLYRVHECVFGVLALESEPVDPRL